MGLGISIKAITWNEELLLPLWYKWYKERFPLASFIIYDNMSDDGTDNIATKLGIEVVKFSTDGKFNDITHRGLKNLNFYDLVIFSDLDEFLDINEEDVKKDMENSVNIWRFQAFDMFGMNYGKRNGKYDKYPLVNRSEIIPNYDFGAHNMRPQTIGNNKIKYSEKVYNLYHHKYPTLDYYLERTRLYKERFDKENKNLGHGKEYFLPEEELILKYNKNKEKAIKIL